jgi:TM2 domain-containing membrane protein YozV
MHAGPGSLPGASVLVLLPTRTKICYNRNSEKSPISEIVNSWECDMAGQGSGGNVLAALCSFFIPGLGQLLQGRLLAALLQFVLAVIFWFPFFLGWIIHIWSAYDAAKFEPKSDLP